MKHLNGYEEAFLPSALANKSAVMVSTWGHLALKRNKKYHGTILFSVSEWNSIGHCLVKANFNNGLEDSPWLFEALNEFISSQDLEAGFYKWTGDFKNYEFTGKIENILSPSPIRG